MAGSEDVIHATDESFEREVLKAEKPSLVDFWAPWCNPCRMLGPLLEEIAAEYKNRINVIKINIDENPKTAAAFKIKSIPTMILFKDGNAAGSLIGLVPKETLERFIEQGTKK